MLKVDLVMWTYNGAKTLPRVLQRLEQVIPQEFVGQKIVSDDHSTDETRQIAESYGWTVVLNGKRGISDNANNALRLVRSDVFCSFEQDLLLAPDWWVNVAVNFPFQFRLGASSGMRFSSCPGGLTDLQKYVALKYRGEHKVAPWLLSKSAASFTLGKTLDNTVFSTKALRRVGGFPRLCTNAGVDTVLAYRFQQAGYAWMVNYNVQSVHLRCGLRDELKHQESYGRQITSINHSLGLINVKSPINHAGLLYRLLYSPFSGLFVAWQVRNPTVAYIHPLIRLYYFKGLVS